MSVFIALVKCLGVSGQLQTGLTTKENKKYNVHLVGPELNKLNETIIHFTGIALQLLFNN
jgi:hypothetical protein